MGLRPFDAREDVAFKTPPSIAKSNATHCESRSYQDGEERTLHRTGGIHQWDPHPAIRAVTSSLDAPNHDSPSNSNNSNAHTTTVGADAFNASCISCLSFCVSRLVSIVNIDLGIVVRLERRIGFARLLEITQKGDTPARQGIPPDRISQTKGSQVFVFYVYSQQAHATANRTFAHCNVNSSHNSQEFLQPCSRNCLPRLHMSSIKLKGQHGRSARFLSICRSFLDVLD